MILQDNSEYLEVQILTEYDALILTRQLFYYGRSSTCSEDVKFESRTQNSMFTISNSCEGRADSLRRDM